MKKNISLIIIGVAAAGLLALCLYFLLRGPKPATAAMEHHEEKAGHSDGAGKEVELNKAQFDASGIVLGTFETKNLSEVINANGYTKLPPQNQADVSVFMGGVVKSIKVIEGQKVSAGQVLATMESLEFARLQQDFLTSKSNLEFLTAEYARQKTLSDENVNARKTFERTQADHAMEAARYHSLQKQLAMMHLDSTGTAGTTVPVLAPISGFVTDVNVKIGSRAESGSPLFSIVDNTKMHVDLLVYEKDLQKVKPGQKVRFVLTNQDNTEITGEIFSVGKAFENETKSVAVHADIKNEQQLLIPGMYVNALIDIGSNPVNALPEEAVVKADGRAFIFVLEEESGASEAEEAGHDHEGGHSHEEEEHDESGELAGTHGETYHFQRVEVTTGTSQLGYVQVTSVQHLAPNAKLVLKGAYYIQSHLLKSEGGGGHEH